MPSIWQSNPNEPICEAKYLGIGDNIPRYPSWRYHDYKDPVLVKNTDEDEEIRKQGYDVMVASRISNRQLINWYWDLEDMSSKQLSVFAREEYGVDLPADGDQERLMKAVMELARYSPMNRGRIALMAHTIKMNYEEAQNDVRRMMKGGTKEVVTYEMEA